MHVYMHAVSEVLWMYLCSIGYGAHGANYKTNIRH